MKIIFMLFFSLHYCQRLSILSIVPPKVLKKTILERKKEETFTRSSWGMIDKIKLNYADLLWASLLPPMFEAC